VRCRKWLVIEVVSSGNRIVDSLSHAQPLAGNNGRVDMTAHEEIKQNNATQILKEVHTGNKINHIDPNTKFQIIPTTFKNVKFLVFLGGCLGNPSSVATSSGRPCQRLDMDFCNLGGPEKRLNVRCECPTQDSGHCSNSCN
jgi:hypothetical protein